MTRSSANHNLLLRPLKGAPLCILLIIGLSQQRLTRSRLQSITGYREKTVSLALRYLGNLELVECNRSCLALTSKGYQFPVFASLPGSPEAPAQSEPPAHTSL